MCDYIVQIFCDLISHTEGAGTTSTECACAGTCDHLLGVSAIAACGIQ